MRRYALIDKAVGETPLTALERYRKAHPELSAPPADSFWMQMPLLQMLRRKSRMGQYDDEANTSKERQLRQKYPPMAYAGRLDPMADGKLLILIGDECKQQQRYHGLDKEYEVQVLFGVSSDTGDVLGRLATSSAPRIAIDELTRALRGLVGDITFPYPHFSSKTVDGKPLHVWTLENRLDEIEIPTYTAHIHRLARTRFETLQGRDIAAAALEKIDRIPTVTEPSKALGNDFRRADVRADWNQFIHDHGDELYTITTIRCICSSGLYMRTLADKLAQRLGTRGLAYHIHRTKIGRYCPLFGIPFWQKP